MSKTIDDRGRAARSARRAPERSLLDAHEYRKRSRNEANRDGSAARTIELLIRGPLGLAAVAFISYIVLQ